jgi:hypothetical protein
MMLVLTILIAIGVIAMIWRGFVREDQELTTRSSGTEMHNAPMRRDNLVMAEFGEEFTPVLQPDRQDPVNETSILDLEEDTDAAESQPLDAGLQQMEQTEAAMQEALFRDLERQLADTASILEQVEQCVLTLQAIEPFQQQLQQLLTTPAVDSVHLLDGSDPSLA